jgi:hypothetical protein
VTSLLITGYEDDLASPDKQRRWIIASLECLDAVLRDIPQLAIVYDDVG